jgi:hypothetical protein
LRQAVRCPTLQGHSSRATRSRLRKQHGVGEKSALSSWPPFSGERQPSPSDRPTAGWPGMRELITLNWAGCRTAVLGLPEQVASPARAGQGGREAGPDPSPDRGKTSAGQALRRGMAAARRICRRTLAARMGHVGLTELNCTRRGLLRCERQVLCSRIVQASKPWARPARAHSHHCAQRCAGTGGRSVGAAGTGIKSLVAGQLTSPLLHGPLPTSGSRA